jgi:hypothetical protein
MLGEVFGIACICRKLANDNLEWMNSHTRMSISWLEEHHYVFVIEIFFSSWDIFTVHACTVHARMYNYPNTLAIAMPYISDARHKIQKLPCLSCFLRQVIIVKLPNGRPFLLEMFIGFKAFEVVKHTQG